MAEPLTIGILAGMGPRSTGPFLEAVLDECEWQHGARTDSEYPHMLVYSLPTPFYPDRPALMATRSTAEAGLYQSAFGAAGLEAVHGEQLQIRTDRLIAAVKYGAAVQERENLWKKLQTLLEDIGTNTLLLACTDLSSLVPMFRRDGYTVVDSSRGLAAATVREYLRLAGRAESKEGIGEERSR